MLTDEGKLYADTGSPEAQLFLAIPPEGGIPREELQVSTVLFFVLKSVLESSEYIGSALWFIHCNEV